MRRTQLQSFKDMSIKVKPGKNPLGTEHVFKMLSANKGQEAIYAVINVTLQHAFAPEVAEPNVYLRLSRKTQFPVDNFICLPISVFVALSTPFGDDDIFWDDGKSVMA